MATTKGTLPLTAMDAACLPSSDIPLTTDRIMNEDGIRAAYRYYLGNGKVVANSTGTAATTAAASARAYSIEVCDDDAKPKQGFAANRKFVFERDKFQTHFSESELGPSYSVWVPWDKAGGDLKTISLIPIFKSGNGTIVKGGQSVNVLPGKTPSETETAENEGESNSAKRKPTVQTAGFSTEFDNEKIGMASYLESTGAKQMGLNSRDESTASNQRKSDVTTIVLPRTMTNRLNSLAPQAPFKRQRRQTTAPQTSNATLPQENDVQSKPERESSLSKPFSNSFEDRQGVFGLPGSHN